MGKEIASGIPLVIIGKLVDKQSCPQTASVLYGLVMKYEVVSVVEGEYPHPVIYVVHGAPELPRTTFNKVNHN